MLPAARASGAAIGACSLVCAATFSVARLVHRRPTTERAHRRARQPRPRSRDRAAGRAGRGEAPLRAAAARAHRLREGPVVAHRVLGSCRARRGRRGAAAQPGEHGGASRRGVEFPLRWTDAQTLDLVGWLAYTFSCASRPISRGCRSCPCDSDQPHALTAVASSGSRNSSSRARGCASSRLPRHADQRAARLRSALHLFPARPAPRSRVGLRQLAVLTSLEVTNHMNVEQWRYSFDHRSCAPIYGIPVSPAFASRGVVMCALTIVIERPPSHGKNANSSISNSPSAAPASGRGSPCPRPPPAGYIEGPKAEACSGSRRRGCSKDPSTRRAARSQGSRTCFPRRPRRAASRACEPCSATAAAASRGSSATSGSP